MTTRCTFTDGRCITCGIERQPPYPLRRCRPGLGDLAARGLEAVGVTKPRAKALAQLAGFENCLCHQAHAALNRLGHAIGLGGPGKVANLTTHENPPPSATIP